MGYVLLSFAAKMVEEFGCSSKQSKKSVADNMMQRFNLRHDDATA